MRARLFAWTVDALARAPWCGPRRAAEARFRGADGTVTIPVELFAAMAANATESR
jgi:hypothetical protein